MTIDINAIISTAITKAIDEAVDKRIQPIVEAYAKTHEQVTNIATALNALDIRVGQLRTGEMASTVNLEADLLMLLNESGRITLAIDHLVAGPFTSEKHPHMPTLQRTRTFSAVWDQLREDFSSSESPLYGEMLAAIRNDISSAIADTDSLVGNAFRDAVQAHLENEVDWDHILEDTTIVNAVIGSYRLDERIDERIDSCAEAQVKEQFNTFVRDELEDYILTAVRENDDVVAQVQTIVDDRLAQGEVIVDQVRGTLQGLIHDGALSAQLQIAL